MPRTRYVEQRSTPAPNGCRIWTGSTNSKGYGNALNGDLAHRVAFEAYVRPLAIMERVTQTCGNRLCVARDHLVVGARRRGSPRLASNHAFALARRLDRDAELLLDRNLAREVRVE